MEVASAPRRDKRVGSLDGEKVRAAILKSDTNTVFGGFRLDADGFQTGHKMVMFQWQDGKKVIVWPDELSPHPQRLRSARMANRTDCPSAAARASDTVLPSACRTRRP
jgi:hypothetical protein